MKLKTVDALSVVGARVDEDLALAAGAPDLEGFKVLVSMAGKRFAPLPAETIARHVLSVTPDVDWPVRRAALEALLRRFRNLERDNLRVVKCPARGAALGMYRIGQKRTALPYQTLIKTALPLAGSCDCADFLRGSLGLCKHMLTALVHIYGNKRRLALAEREQASVRRADPSGLRWNSVRPTLGAGDLLGGVYWEGDLEGLPEAERFLARRLFNLAGASPSLKKLYAEDAGKRLSLVRMLCRLAKNRRRALTEPALMAFLAEEQLRLERCLQSEAVRRSAEPHLRTLKRKLYPYQTAGVHRFLQSGRLLLADDMGLGKTIQAIAGCHVLWHAGKVRRGLLIVPASLKSQWLREWQLFTDLPVQVVEGPAPQRARVYHSNRRGFLIANYEQVLRDLDRIAEWNADLIVLDEAQRIKNWATKTAAYVKSLAPHYRLVLTGTPMENRLEEFASILEWIDSFALEPKWRLIPWHSTWSDGKHEVHGARNLDTIRERTRHCMLRRVRKEVLTQLPQRTDSRIPVAMTEAQVAAHDDLKKPIARFVNISRQRPLTQAEFLKLMSLLTAQRIISNGLEQLNFETAWPEVSQVRCPSDAFLQGLNAPKLIELREIVRQVVIEQGRRAVIFSQWRRMLTLAQWALSGLLSDARIKAVFFTGHETQRRRTQNIVDFHDEPEVRVLFATDAGGVGLNLQRAASCCINLELPWNPAVLEQRIGRIYRLGQKQPINVYNLVCDYGIEARLADLVSNKQALFKGLFDGDSNEVRFERGGSFMGRLEKIIEPVSVPHARRSSGKGEAADAPEEQIDDAAAALDSVGDLAPEPAPTTDDRTIEPLREVAGDSLAHPTFDTAALRELFAAVRISAGDGGTLRVEAPPQAAAQLACVFEGLAAMLRAARSE